MVEQEGMGTVNASSVENAWSFFLSDKVNVLFRFSLKYYIFEQIRVI